MLNIVFNVTMDELKRYVMSVGLTTFASELGVSVQRLSNWIDRGGVPLEQCTAVEDATSGAVMRWHLRPDDWHVIWPELKKRKDAPFTKKVAA